MAALLLGTSWAASFRPTRTPSEIKLKWLPDEEHGGVELPHMEITFADGTTDEIFLNVDPENPCFYHGALKSDIESEVEVDGCRDELETVEIVSRLIPCGLVFLLLEEGNTFEIDPTEGINFNSTESDILYPPSFQGVASKGALPRSAVAKIHVRYDQSLVKMMGSQAAARRKAKAVVESSKVWFKRNLGIRMDIHIQVLTIKFYDGWIRTANEAQAIALQGKGRQGDEDVHPTAWITAGDGSNTLRGIARLGGICGGKYSGPLFPFFLSFILLKPLSRSHL